MDERFVDLRSTKNPKARIKMLSGHFETKKDVYKRQIGGLTVTWPAAAMMVNGVGAVLLSGLAYGFFRRHQVNR